MTEFAFRVNQVMSSLSTKLLATHDIYMPTLTQNSIGGVLPSELGLLTLMTTIREADTCNEARDWSNRHLTGALPTQLGQLTGLEALDLSLNTFKAALPSQVQHLNEDSCINLLQS